MEKGKRILNYHIHLETLALQPVMQGNKILTRIIEQYQEFTIPRKPARILRRSCVFTKSY